MFPNSLINIQETYLVPNETDLHSVATGSVPDALHPVGGVVQGLRVRHIVHQHDAVRPSVVGLRDFVEFLLRRGARGKQTKKNASDRRVLRDRMSSLRCVQVTTRSYTRVREIMHTHVSDKN